MSSGYFEDKSKRSVYAVPSHVMALVPADLAVRHAQAEAPLPGKRQATYGIGVVFLIVAALFLGGVLRAGK
jgi:hypothetical protein